jgi:hypothetical protein
MTKLKLIALIMVASVSYCIAEEDDCDGGDSFPCHNPQTVHYYHFTETQSAGNNVQECTSSNDDWGPCEYLDSVTCSYTITTTNDITGYVTSGPGGGTQVDETYCNG